MYCAAQYIFTREGISVPTLQDIIIGMIMSVCLERTNVHLSMQSKIDNM